MERLHRHGVCTTATVVRVWEDEGSDGGIQLRAVVNFDVPDRLLGSTCIPGRRRGGTLQVGESLPVVYDSRQPSRAHVVPEGSPRLLVAAGGMATIALGAGGFACFLVGMASPNA